MIQLIREQLKLSRQDMSFYLGLSRDMIKSIELGRRQIPFDSHDAVAALYKAILDGKAHSLVTDVAPATSQQTRLMKRLYRRYSLRLNKYTLQLEKMQESYATASKNLGIYQRFAASLTAGRNAGDGARLKWAKLKIEELTQRIKLNNLTAQEILSMEIAGLQIRIEKLEGK